MLRLTLTNILVAVAFVASAQATCVHGTSLMRREEGHIPVAAFGYRGDRLGPTNWANLNASYEICRTGTHQAPIVLTNDIPYASNPPVWRIPNVESATFENLGSTVEVFLKDGEIQYEGKTYKSIQYHFHVPSEHRIDDEFFVLEAHFVHQAEDKSLLVVAVLFELSTDGQETELLTSTIVNLAQISKPGTGTTTGPLNFEPIIQTVVAGPLFVYSGSLTTPPCAEGVTFLILDVQKAEKKPQVGPKTFNALKQVMKFNSRFSQNKPGDKNTLAYATAQHDDGHSNNSTTGSLPFDIVQALLASGQHLKIETTSTTTVELVKSPPAPEPTSTEGDVPVQTGSEGPSSDTESPAETGGIHAPGPATPVRRSNLLRRRN